MSSYPLAIVIPAYKPDFLQRTLDSIAAQTCRDFVVYVGDDCSPSDIGSIVKPYSEKLNLVYERFDRNMGGSDLVAHWERTIRLGSEPWVWLFSDDDVLPCDAVERFFLAKESNHGASFFRLPLCTIDHNDEVICKAVPFSAPFNTPAQYLLEYFNSGRRSAACEYVFRREIFDKTGMVHFPCAWCSDIAIWYSYASASNGIVNVEGAPVCWRNAFNVNISSTQGLYDKKMEATTQFISWLNANYKDTVDKEFKRAVRQYLKTILSISLECNFSRKNLRKLVMEYAKMSPERALRLYLEYRNKCRI